MHPDDKGRTFNKDGTMTVSKDGQKKIVRLKRIKETESSTNGLTMHTTTQWEDGYVSCTCQGFVYVKGDSQRTCKHIKTSRACNFQDMLTPDKFVKQRGGFVPVKQINETDDRKVEI